MIKCEIMDIYLHVWKIEWGFPDEVISLSTQDKSLCNEATSMLTLIFFPNLFSEL